MESDAKPEQQVFDGISNFDKSALKSVKTEVKDTLPTKEGEKNNQSLWSCCKKNAVLEEVKKEEDCTTETEAPAVPQD